MTGDARPDIVWVAIILGSALPWLGLLQKLVGSLPAVRQEDRRIRDVILVSRAEAITRLFKDASGVLFYAGDPEKGGEGPSEYVRSYCVQIEELDVAERKIDHKVRAYRRQHGLLVAVIVVGGLNLLWHVVGTTTREISDVMIRVNVGIGILIGVCALIVVSRLYCLDRAVHKMGDEPRFRGVD